MSKHLLIVAYAFPPSSAVGAMRPLRMVKYLTQHTDWQVTVIAADREFARLDPSLADEIPASVAVHRVRSVEPLSWLERVTARPGGSVPTGATAPASTAAVAAAPPRRPTGLRQLVRDALTTPDPQGLWTVPVVAKACALHRRRRFDAVLVTSPPWSAQVAGDVLGRVLRIPWLADYRDPWNDIDRGGRSRLFERLSRLHEEAILPRAAAVLSTSDTYTDILRERFPQRPPAVFSTLYNGFDEAKIPTAEEPAAARFTIVHLGTLYEIWQPYTFFEALEIWLKRHPERRGDVVLKFVGRPRRRTLARLSSLGLDDVVEVTGFVEHEEAIRQCRAADLLLLALGSGDGVPAGWLPSKLFEYVAFDRPILANVGRGEARRLIEGAGAGTAVADGDQDGFMAVLDDFYARKQAAADGRIAWRNDPDAVAALTQRHLVRQLATILDRVTDRGGRR